jgi:teichuronic acid biosynthesis glycosyltransferase TuaG
VIIPAFNPQLSHINAAVKSALNQTHTAIEIIIIDDNSTTPIKAKHSPYLSNKRVRILINKSNLGAAQSRNTGVSESKGKYIAYLDADDQWHPTKLERQIEFMKSTGAVASNTGYLCTNKCGKYIFSVKAFQKLTWLKLWATTNVGCSTVMIDQTQLDRVPMMPLYKNSHDTALWSQLVSSNLFLGLNEPLTNYRIGHISATSNRYDVVKYNLKVWVNECGLMCGCALWILYIMNAVAKRQGIYNFKLVTIKKFWQKIF